MKKLIVLLTVVSFAFIVKATNETNYVIVGDKVYFSNNVKIGLANLRLETEDGLTFKAPLKIVDAYMVDGTLCERLPLFCPDGRVKCTALLELVSFRNGLKLYKLCSYKNNKNLGCYFFDETNRESMYFVYKDGKLHLRVNEKNAETVFDFFHVKFISNNT
jgi:hypothetical protein